MLRRVIIISSGVLLAGYCVAITLLTLFGRNPATLHLTKFLLIGYAAINGVLTPFGISGIIGGSSRKKALIRTFVTVHWWLSTLILIGVNVFNIILARRDRGDIIRKCKADLAKSRPDVDFSARCAALADNEEKNAIIETFSVGGVMLILGIILLIVGMREYNSLRSEEEDKSLIEKSVKMNPLVEESLSSSTITNTSSNDGDPDPYEVGGRYNTNNFQQPSNSIRAVTTNVDLTRPTNVNAMNTQYAGPVRYPTNSRNIPPSHQGQGLTRNQTVPLARYPVNNGVNVTRQPTIGNGVNVMRQPTIGNGVNVTRQPTIGNGVNVTRQPTIGNRVNATRQPTIGNAYTQRNYVGAQQPIYPMAPQRSLSVRQTPQPSYVTQMVIPPPKPTISEVDDFNNYYVRKPYQTTTPYLTRMGMNQ